MISYFTKYCAASSSNIINFLNYQIILVFSGRRQRVVSSHFINPDYWGLFSHCPAILQVTLPFILCHPNYWKMKNKKYINSKNTKFVRIDNSTWIETDSWIPDDVARMQFLQKMHLSKPTTFIGQVKNDNMILNGWIRRTFTVIQEYMNSG